jgi:hypothetical protein
MIGLKNYRELPIVMVALCLVLYSISMPSTAFAQNANTAFTEEALQRFKAGDVREDFLVPTTPAYAVLGVTPEEVIRLTAGGQLPVGLNPGAVSRQ